MVKATWIAARPQWYFWSMGLTNSVQPYCRLAIITMQMMPKISCPQRVASDAVARVGTVVAVVVDILLPPLVLVLVLIAYSWLWSLVFYRAPSDAQPLSGISVQTLLG